MDYPEKINLLKRNVLQMLRERNNSGSESPGGIWAGVLHLFDYIINLTPENYLNIRFHAGYVTGSNALEYYHLYPPLNPERYAGNSGYIFYTQDIPQDYWVGEPPTPNIHGPMGVNYRGKTINYDICRYQSCIANLYSTGVLKSLGSSKKRNLVLEIGGGYGGLAHHLGNILIGNSTYIVMDLPEMLLFSGGFLIVNNPKKRIYIYDKKTLTSEFLTSGIYKYDYVLLPNYILKKLYRLKEINLMLNMQSFQEMTKEQVEEYLKFGKSKLSGYMYSDNIDKHPANKELGQETITTLASKYFDLFPEPELYGKVFGKDKPWLYKCYIGTPKGKDITLPDCPKIKFISSQVKYSVVNNRGNIKIRAEGLLLGYIILLGVKLLHTVFRFRFLNFRQELPELQA
jgi:hypothetical protein